MARVTVEDCVTKVPNRFELVLLASQRSRALAGGITPTLDRENDKNPVIALREIAEGTVNTEDLRQSVISGLQKHVEFDEPEDDSVAILAAAEKEWAGVTADDTPCKPEAVVKEAVKASDPDAGNDADAAAVAATEDAATDDTGTEDAMPGVESGDVAADPKADEV